MDSTWLLSFSVVLLPSHYQHHLHIFSIIHKLSQDSVHTWSHSTSDILHSNYPAPIANLVLPAYSLKYIHHTCSSISKGFLILDLFLFPFQSHPGLNSTSICLRHQSLSFFPPSYLWTLWSAPNIHASQSPSKSPTSDGEAQ